MKLKARRYQFAAIRGRCNHFVAQSWKNDPKIIPDIRLIIGDGDPKRLGHGLDLGNVMMNSAPFEELFPTAICPPCASTILLAIAMPRPVPFVFVVKNGSNTL